jgi:type II secretory pathway component PulC
MRFLKGDLALRYSRILSKRAAAYQVGFRIGDILVRFDGLTDRVSEAEILVTLNNRIAGDEIPVTVLRSGKQIKLALLVK